METDKRYCASTRISELRVVKGLHTGARFSLHAQQEWSIGSDPDCTVVLLDDNVAGKHCVLSTDGDAILCRAVSAPVTVGGRELAPGQSTYLSDFESVCCGDGIVAVGPADVETWPEPERTEPGHVATGTSSAPGRVADSWRRWWQSQERPPIQVLAISIGVVALGMISLTYAALSVRPVDPEARMAAAGEWLDQVSPAGSELRIHQDGPEQFTVAGYVRNSYQRELLAASAATSEFAPRIQVYAVDQMLSSLTRLAQLEGIPCTPAYDGQGAASCTTDAPSEGAAQRLLAIAGQIPGLEQVTVNVASGPPPPTAPPTPPARIRPVAPEPGSITRKFSVFITEHNRYIIGEYMDRYEEGDIFDGYRIKRIELDRVTFERDGYEYTFYVAAFRQG